MKNRIIMVALLLLYCIPFAFLCVYFDAMHTTMLFYALSAVCFAGFSYVVVKTKNAPIIYIGSLLSLASSLAAAKICSLEQMNYFFKPFTAYSLITVISLVAVLLQSIVVVIVKRKAK